MVTSMNSWMQLKSDKDHNDSYSSETSKPTYGPEEATGINSMTFKEELWNIAGIYYKAQSKIMENKMTELYDQ